MCVIMPNFIKIGQTVAEIWRFNSFQNRGRPPSWICGIRIFLMVCVVKGHILHQRTKFHKGRSNRYGDIVIFVIFQVGGRRHFGFSKIRNFNDRSAVGGQYASFYQILSTSVKRLQRYSDLTVFSK